MSGVQSSQDRFIRRLASHRLSVPLEQRDRFDSKISEIESLTGRVNLAVSQLMQLTGKAVREQTAADLEEEKKKFNPDSQESRLNGEQEAMLAGLASSKSAVREEDWDQFEDTLQLVRAYAKRMNAAIAHLAYLTKVKAES